MRDVEREKESEKEGKRDREREKESEKEEKRDVEREKESEKEGKRDVEREKERVADNKNSTCIAMAHHLDERVIGLPGGELAGTDLLEEPD
nr:hypothetical protein BgiMline_033673 [Biomphalaria glabrata]